MFILQTALFAAFRSCSSGMPDRIAELSAEFLDDLDVLDGDARGAVQDNGESRAGASRFPPGYRSAEEGG